MNNTVIERTYNEAFQALWIELQFAKQSNIACDVIYRQHNPGNDCYTILKKLLIAIALPENRFVINILLAQTCNYAQRLLDCLQSQFLLPTIDKPTRLYNNSATLLNFFFFKK